MDETPPPAFHAAYSHLFRGARLRGDRGGACSTLTPASVLLCFSDGTSVKAEIVVGGSEEEDYALDVPAYRTAAGHPIPGALWPVVNASTDPVESEFILTLGRRLLHRDYSGS